jgi:hypothetical protein
LKLVAINRRTVVRLVMCETGPDVARKIPFIWIGTFGGFTVCCLLLATLAGGAVGTVVRPHRHDAVVFLSVGGNRSCPAGNLQSGVVLAGSGDRVRAISARGTGGKAATRVYVNGQRAATVARVWPAKPYTVRSGQYVILSRASGCAGQLIATVPASSIVAYGRTTVGARIAEIRRQLHQRIVAEKYVAGAYLLVTAFFGLWLFIHGGRLLRLEREVAIYRQQADARSSTD